MKTQSIFLAILIATGALFFNACGEAEQEATDEEQAQEELQEGIAEANFFVRGNCEMCQERIQDALNEVDGVEEASWSIESSEADVRYDEEKVSEEDLHLAVSAVGHRTNEVEADEEAYNDLPPCCLDPDDEDYIEM